MVILNQAFQLWEIPATKYEDLGQYDIGIVLGGMVNHDRQFDRLQFKRGVDRVLQALELYKKGYIHKILFVGGSGSLVYKEDKEGVWVKKYLLTLGLPEEDILIESESRNTHENAMFSKKILEGQATPGKYLLITSAFHMRRSLGCFKKEGIEAQPYSTDRYSGPPKFDLDFLFIPDIEAVQGWGVLIHEIVGYWTYRASGHI